MLDKSTSKNSTDQIHRIPAGIRVGDTATELFACRESGKVFGISDGRTIAFESICPKKRAMIYEQLLKDDAAMADLRDLTPELALEQYAFCIYGAADSEPDFAAGGQLGKPDNFICSDHCRCLNWASKQMTINGNALTKRELEVLNHLASDKPDKMVAAELNISENTLDTHKRHLFDKAGVNSKSGLIVKAAKSKVIQ